MVALTVFMHAYACANVADAVLNLGYLSLILGYWLHKLVVLMLALTSSKEDAGSVLTILHVGGYLLGHAFTSNQFGSQGMVLQEVETHLKWRNSVTFLGTHHILVCGLADGINLSVHWLQ